MRRLDLGWSRHDGRVCLHARGWDAQDLHTLAACSAAELGRRLVVLPEALLASAPRLGDLQPLAGRFAVEGDALCFLPRFPFIEETGETGEQTGEAGASGASEAGGGYALLVASEDPARAGQPEVWTIALPRPAQQPATHVVAIYPTAPVLPVNQLKLYVQFSGPMSEGWAARAVQVCRAGDGARLDDVFLASETELWDREHRRLTLLLDPGRIKRGLVPNAEAGYPLVEGVPVVVSVATAFRDAAGRPLCAGLERRFAVGPPLRARVDPRAWRLAVPQAGGCEPLALSFDRPFDRALLAHCLWVHDAAGTPLRGQGRAEAGERGWRFVPWEPWAPGRHSVIVDPRLEDLAGNSLLRVFDRDLSAGEETPVPSLPVALPFSCPTPAADRGTMQPREGGKR